MRCKWVAGCAYVVSMGILLYAQVASSQGIAEAYAIRGAVATRIIEVTSHFAKISESDDLALACKSLSSDLEGVRVEASAELCTVKTRFAGLSGSLTLSLDANGRVGCESNLEQRFLASQCGESAAKIAVPVGADHHPVAVAVLLALQPTLNANGSDESFPHEALRQMLDLAASTSPPEYRADDRSRAGLLLAFEHAYKAGEAPLSRLPVLNWLFERHEQGPTALVDLGRRWAEFMMARPVLAGAMSTEVTRMRFFDLWLSALQSLSVAPEFAKGVANYLDSVSVGLKGVQKDFFVVLLRALVDAVEGNRARSLAGILQVQAALNGPLKDALGRTGSAVAQILHWLELSGSGKLYQLMERIESDTRTCNSGAFISVDTCSAIRLTTAETALQNLQLRLATSLLTPPPSTRNDLSADLRPQLVAVHLTLVAKLAALEGDFKTARTALDRVEQTALGSVNPIGGLGMRLDAILGRTSSANAGIEATRSLLATMPAAARLETEYEIALANWALDAQKPDIAEFQRLQKVEFRLLEQALRETDTSLARTIVNLRAQRRDRNLAVAIKMPALGALLAWQEGAWFKGLEADVATVSHRLNMAAEFMQPNPDEVRRQLGTGFIVLDFQIYASQDAKSFRPGERRLAAVMLSDLAGPVLFDLGAFAPIEAGIAQLRMAIQQREHARIEQLALNLSKVLFGPIQSQLTNDKLLVVIPDGALHALPFDLLVRPGAKGFSPGLQVRTAQSLREALNPVVPVGAPVVIVSSPSFGELTKLGTMQFPDLPGTRTEAEAISRALRDKSAQAFKIIADSHATETAVRSLQSPAVLHFATHGFALTKTGEVRDSGGVRGLMVVSAPVSASAIPISGLPLHVASSIMPRLLQYQPDPLEQVGLALANANKPGASDPSENGILTGREARGLDLHGTALVVLSACQTGLGESIDGEAVGSMQRAMHQAGARFVISTLWPIDDAATAEFMGAFYRGIGGGSAVADALAFAKKEMQQSATYADPIFWAAFQLSGPVARTPTPDTPAADES